MREGETFAVHGVTFTVQRVLGPQRYVVGDETGRSRVVEGPDAHGRFAVLIPTVPVNAFCAFTKEPLS